MKVETRLSRTITLTGKQNQLTSCAHCLRWIGRRGTEIHCRRTTLGLGRDALDNHKGKGTNHPQEIREKIAQKRKIRKRWQMTQDLRINTELNCITQDLRRTILETKQRSIEAYLQEISDDASTDYSLWKPTKRLKRPTMNIPTVRKRGTIKKRRKTLLNIWNGPSNQTKRKPSIPLDG
jgi:hypothetical protein